MVKMAYHSHSFDYMSFISPPDISNVYAAQLYLDQGPELALLRAAVNVLTTPRTPV